MRPEVDPLVSDIADYLRLDGQAPSKTRLDSGWYRLRRALDEGALARPPRRARVRRFVLAGAMAAAAAGLLAWHALPVDQPLRYVVKGTGPGTKGALATHEHAAVEFSDDSRLVIDPASQLRVLGTDARGAHVALETGAMQVFVTPRKQASWRFDAGPFTVVVKGTSFRLAYDPGQGRLRLRMHTGEVEIRGPRPARSLTLRAGESTELFASPAPAPAATAPVDAANPSADPLEPADPAGLVDPGIPAKPAEPREGARKAPARALPRVAVKASRPSPGRASADWSTLIAQGDFAAIVDDANHQGLDQVLATAPAPALATLADAARYTRNVALAQQALLAIRARFPGSTRSTDAAFFLGRLGEHGAGSAEAAIAWYETYQREAPRGPYAAEAMGRELSLLAKQGSPRSRALARRYLEQFPRGSHGEIARSLLQ